MDSYYYIFLRIVDLCIKLVLFKFVENFGLRGCCWSFNACFELPRLLQSSMLLRVLTSASGFHAHFGHQHRLVGAANKIGTEN